MTRNIPLLVVAGLLAIAGCKSVGGGGSTGLPNAVFSGTVEDQQGNRIGGARVAVNAQATVTAPDGTFQLSARGRDTYVLVISHPEFADLSHVSRTGITGQTWRLVRAHVETVDPTNPITLTDSRPGLPIGGAGFELPANSLVDSRGHVPAGPVRAAIATLDVSSGEGPGNWAARTDDGRDAYLVSYGAVFVQFSDAAGTVAYRLRRGSTGKLTLPVVPSMTAHAGAPAQFWYYDTKDGYWKKTGSAAFDPVSKSYVGTVSHLSTLNTDIAKTDAACLKVTLDPSVAVGNQLRIRYHSGGTPFGQSPKFVLDATDNAAYRLPANTNVLLELLNPSNQVFGNLVVEDPAGTALVNTVVNMGPAIPAGHTLWPLAPFTDCHAVLLRLGMPQVELRINATTAVPGVRDDPTDDYITWAPTFSLARLATPGMPVTVVLTNDSPNLAGGGNVFFAADQSPWPVNTTATATTLTLALPGDGSWVPFVIAGDPLTPGTNDKDTIIQAHLSTAGGAIVGSRALMVRVRKNANTLTPSERSRFLFAWKNFRNKVGSNYVLFQEMHRLVSSSTNDQGHMQPAFLPWHRAMLLQVERELQKIDPSVSLHYWNWDAAAPNIFAENFMGRSDTSVGSFGIALPILEPSNPLNGWNTNLPFSSGELRRRGRDTTLAPSAGTFTATSVLNTRTNYGLRSSSASFSYGVEMLSHNPAHGWPCVGGHVRFPERSAADPLFYLLHSNIDRQWASWQRAQNRFGVVSSGMLTFPAPAHYDNSGNWNDAGVVDWFRGAFLEDGMWPWDGTTDGAFGRGERPLNQGVPGGDPNIPLSAPMVPMTPFPASVHTNLWPPVDTIPKPRHMIDYLGKFLPPDGLGFCYDDVPY